VGLNGPFAIGSLKHSACKKSFPNARDNHNDGNVAAIPLINVLLFMDVISII
jgi:hypothetical protein